MSFPWESGGEATFILLCIGKSIDEEQTMRIKTALTVISATAALGTGGALATGAAAFDPPTTSASSSPVAAGAAGQQIEGRIVAVSRPARMFTLRHRERETATLRPRHNKRAGGIRHARARGHDLVGHDVGDDRGRDLADHDVADDRGGQPGRDDGSGHDAGDDHGRHGRH